MEGGVYSHHGEEGGGGQATKGGERGVGDGVNVYFFGVKRVLWYALHNILFKSLEHLAACER